MQSSQTVGPESRSTLHAQLGFGLVLFPSALVLVWVFPHQVGERKKQADAGLSLRGNSVTGIPQGTTRGPNSICLPPLIHLLKPNWREES